MIASSHHLACVFRQDPFANASDALDLVCLARRNVRFWPKADLPLGRHQRVGQSCADPVIIFIGIRSGGRALRLLDAASFTEFKIEVCDGVQRVL